MYIAFRDRTELLQPIFPSYNSEHTTKKELKEKLDLVVNEKFDLKEIILKKNDTIQRLTDDSITQMNEISRLTEENLKLKGLIHENSIQLAVKNQNLEDSLREKILKLEKDNEDLNQRIADSQAEYKQLNEKYLKKEEFINLVLTGVPLCEQCKKTYASIEKRVQDKNKKKEPRTNLN